MGFSEIFKDKNEYNEKSIIGFMSFAVMTLTSLVDMITGAFGSELVIQEFIYNSFVITLKQGAFEVATFLQQTPIRVPEVGIGIQGLSSLYSEIIWQFMLVATAEEIMKIAILVFVVLALTARFPRNRTPTYIGAGVAIGLWGIMHTIQALSI